MGLSKCDFYSTELRMTTQVNVIFPEESNDVTPLFEGTPKVLYLLHGLSANCDEWIRFSKIEYYAKKYNLIIIMPEAGRSFYCDMKYGLKYFTYISEELPKICAKWFRLPDGRENTFIVGESMGGYGAVKAALRHPENYSAAASLSGVLDYPSLAKRVYSGEWDEMSPEELVAIHGQKMLVSPEDDVLSLLNQHKADSVKPRVIQLCGTEDFLYENNQKFRQVIEKMNYEYQYMEWRGEHAWPFWDVAIQRAIQFFLNMDTEASPIY